MTGTGSRGSSRAVSRRPPRWSRRCRRRPTHQLALRIQRSSDFLAVPTRFGCDDSQTSNPRHIMKAFGLEHPHPPIVRPLAGVPHALVILEIPECRSRCSWAGLVSISVVPCSEADLNHLT